MNITAIQYSQSVPGLKRTKWWKVSADGETVQGYETKAGAIRVLKAILKARHGKAEISGTDR